MTVAPGAYLDTFEAATAVARDAGLDPSFRDPRGGILEAGPARMPSMLEPWARRGPEPAAAEATLAQERRRLRVEFLEPGAAPTVGDDDAPVLDLLAVRSAPRDLTTAGGPLEMHVAVVIERYHDPGVRRNTWSHTRTHHVGGVDPAYWWPERRDPVYEAWLVERIRARLDGTE